MGGMQQVRVGILEWICGGGLQDTAIEQISESLMDEGRAMLLAVAQDFVSSGHEVVASIDARLHPELQLTKFGSSFQVWSKSGFTSRFPSSWWEVANFADAVVVIAPEFSNILQSAPSLLAPECKLLLNCQGEFLAASCDKWITAQRLDAAGVKHPPTQLARVATEDWLRKNRTAAGKWIIKPKDGAGCEAIRLVDEDSVRDAIKATLDSDANLGMIIQPMLIGGAFSRSAIVDSMGRAYWLPLVTQEFSMSNSMTYHGGRVLAGDESYYHDTLTSKRYPIGRLDEILNAAMAALGQGALGWVGVDLLYSDELNDWIVIEVNPRLTTSFTGLSMSFGSGLMQQMLRAGQGLEVAIGSTWKAINFCAAGKIVKFT
jgi:predicted ATP-grasp superfamily ATP-dependent carboligase